MFGVGGVQELILVMLVIAVLSMTGLWPKIIQGLRELRGDATGQAGFPAHEADMCYKILGLSSTATWQEIERAYRQKAKIHHPDHGGDEDAMRTLNEAYTQLKKHRRA